ncbi:N-acetylmuramoyl-L-alanine amidase [Collinsella aerofaciens]|uniref:N-acetylmuramoyl-L-alanine amidase n=1 Tax=Collinsella aerofaciens TaxID=74426 RepID=UPI00355B0297
MKKVRCAVANLVTAVLVSSSFLAPVSSAYALEFSSLSNNEAEASSSSSLSDFVSEDTEKTAEADSCEDTEETAEADSCNSEVESAAQPAQSPDSSSVDASFQYLYIAQPSLSLGAMQEAAFATASDSDVLTSASLSFVSNFGEERSVEASAFSGNAAGFTFGQDLLVARYFLTGITYQVKDSNAVYSVDLSSEDYSFDVVSSSSSSDRVDNSDDMSVYYADENGNPVEAFSIEEALSGSEDDDGIAAYSIDSRSARKNVRVIALDAGHGGSDSGAQGNGKSEADLTWKIVSACKTKLENYGFKVILAREQSGSYGSNDFLYRVQRCVKQGAQAYISFHINSGSSAAHGAEVYSPTVNGADYTQVSYELAQKVQNNLVALGLTNRGVFQMQVGDEFAVIRCAREAGIPGILIEHGFISNWGDANKYFSDAGCKRLGEADADAIIAQFPKSSWLDYSSVFDVDYYLNKYPDVNEWANGRKDKALDHFINYGMSEGRRGSEAFDVQSYYNEYPDLRAAFGTDLASYYSHYLMYGKKEGRHATGCSKLKGAATKAGGVDYAPVYDPEFYLSRNGDVEKAFTKSTYGGVTVVDDSAVLDHFINYGMSEGRRGSEAFDVQSYYNEYPDLRAAFGTDLASYYSHYLMYGKKEGRHATGCSKLKGAATKAGGVDYAPVYDPEFYLSRNGDVEKAFTKSTYGGVTVVDDSAVLRHFINYGMSEGRRGSEAFDVYSYKTRYLDLRKAYGSNLKGYYLHYLEYGMKEHRNGSSMTGFEGYIMSPPFTSYEDAAAHYSRTVGRQTYPTSVYKSKGSASIDEFCKILYEEASFEGVCPEVLYAQVMKETGYLRFGNLVQANQCNFGGVGATGPGNPGYTFSSVREGLRVQAQHLKAYATTEPLNNPCIDPRFNLVSRGCAPKTTDLNGRWAVPGKGYGEGLNAIVLDVLCM